MFDHPKLAFVPVAIGPRPLTFSVSAPTVSENPSHTVTSSERTGAGRGMDHDGDGVVLDVTHAREPLNDVKA